MTDKRKRIYNRKGGGDRRDREAVGRRRKQDMSDEKCPPIKFSKAQPALPTASLAAPRALLTNRRNYGKWDKAISSQTQSQPFTHRNTIRREMIIIVAN